MPGGKKVLVEPGIHFLVEARADQIPVRRRFREVESMILFNFFCFVGHCRREKKKRGEEKEDYLHQWKASVSHSTYDSTGQAIEANQGVKNDNHPEQ
jgi:hypothetical protein